MHTRLGGGRLDLAKRVAKLEEHSPSEVGVVDAATHEEREHGNVEVVLEGVEGSLVERGGFGHEEHDEGVPLPIEQGKT